MKKKMFEACGGWILTEVLLLVTASNQSSGSGMDCGSSDGRTGVSDMGTGFLCAESSGGRDPDSGHRR